MELDQSPDFTARGQQDTRGSSEAIPATAESRDSYSIYTKREKILIITIISTAATFSGFSSNIYFPSLPTIASDLSVTIELINLTVTSYMVFQGLAPTIWGAVADAKGRRVAYIATFVVYLASCVALANTRNYASLVALRCLQSTGSAATIAIGAGVIGDITIPAERGGFMGIFQAGCLVPVAIGPVIGGVLSNHLGWRSIFWFLAIYSGVFLILLVTILPETLRTLVGDGSVAITGWNQFPLRFYQRRYKARVPSYRAQFTHDLPSKKPVNIFASIQILGDKHVLPIVTFVAIYYTVWQMSVTVLSTLIKTNYGLDDTQLGLTFLANGLGSMLGSLTTGKLLDYDYQRIERKCIANKERLPLDHARLRTVWVWSVMQMSSLIVFGWSMDRQIHISLPIISTFFTGWGAMSIQSMTNTYLVDMFPDQAAASTAAINLMRCLMGAGGTAVALPILNHLGTGWGFVMLTSVLFIALSLIFVQISFGKKFREQEKGRREQDV